MLGAILDKNPHRLVAASQSGLVQRGTIACGTHGGLQVADATGSGESLLARTLVVVERRPGYLRGTDRGKSDAGERHQQGDVESGTGRRCAA